MLIAFVLFYLALNLAVGWWASKKVHTTQDFVLAGRNLPFALATMVTFATWFGSETILGAPREFVHGGVLSIIEEPFGAALGLVIVGTIYARKLYPLKVLTFSDYFQQRFGHFSEKLSAIVMVPSYFGWISAQLVALGLTLHLLLPISTEWGIVFGALLVMTYTLLGGMWSISITDFLHNIILIIGLAFLAFLLYQKTPDVGAIIERQNDNFFQFTPQKQDATSWLTYLAAWITIGLGSIPQQDIFQRVMSAKSAHVAGIASFSAGIMYLSVAMLPLLIAFLGVSLYPSLLSDDMLLIPHLVMKFTPTGIQILFLGALLSALLSTTSGAILAPASVLGENLIKPMMKHPSDRKVLQIIRLSVVLVTFSCIYMAVKRQNIFELVGESSAFGLVSLFIPLNAGLWWKKASSMGSHLSMILGLGVWGYFQFIAPSEIPSIWPGLAASLFGLLLGTYVWPNPPKAAE
ncbi:High-affinity choline transporter [Aquirufa nivalisilvae]|uniref:High-affinity choline transporter n=1 Tax=Aquirufa nivalisilvae TaxID=2516557 RepID=A0A2S2DSV6_9BACT|nr:sodium:solute symporter family protein [Aquirufa nivalisilvae]AWL08455.1 High-affinity choline transporter [Aquirufa nivalisilvae]